ncbi:hypothetical protein F4V57_06215 [Acinetobacter qingfengensis]|uniref:DUF3298 domain-containing protein n=1 Tax=Acinetobacter qingfengensis TaxID=1262585 RepID=A0A1E7RAM0_9GAMM|nr:hypothetical protein [Acinetobacter qingfengensis]KAA8734545.1 hypothetical protein F4V57_06215 [Acinetobacter qingfengensis]OEY96404.1 hypothetical protein BJI46_12225 [Acinetobacter qingfengensis]
MPYCLHYRIFLPIGIMLFLFTACDDDQNKKQPDQLLQQQSQQQGYPVLIATPEAADYSLPFCEKQYCIEIEIQAFHSQDQWFNQITNQQIAELIRKQLGLKQKLTLQQAVDTFIQQSDLWQQQHPQSKPWSLYIQSKVPMQHQEMTLLQLESQYQIADQQIPAEHYFFMLDRKRHQILRLYDVIKPEKRIEFGQFIQQSYQQWKQKLSATQSQNTPATLYWANQDWYVDEQGIVIYYRASDLQLTQQRVLEISLTTEQAKQWLNVDILQQLSLY